MCVVACITQKIIKYAKRKRWFLRRILLWMYIFINISIIPCPSLTKSTQESILAYNNQMGSSSPILTNGIHSIQRGMPHYSSKRELKTSLYHVVLRVNVHKWTSYVSRYFYFLKLLRNLQTYYCLNLHPYQQWIRFSLASCPF